MSRIYFHSQHGEAELRGSERAWLSWLASGPARAYWDLNRIGVSERTMQIMSWVDRTECPTYLLGMYDTAVAEQQRNDAARREAKQHGRRWDNTSFEAQRRLTETLQTCLRVEGLPLQVAGIGLHTLDIELNTALATGSAALALAAKIHGWCEAFAWVEGPDRAWMADIIDAGLHAGIYRRGLWYETVSGAEKKWASQRWEQVTELLRARDDGPVVMSYSVTEQFPDASISTMMPPWPPGVARRWDALTEQQQEERRNVENQWYQLPDEAQWNTAMHGLRERRPWGRIAPHTLFDQTFGPPVTVFDLLASDRDERVRKTAEQASAAETRAGENGEDADGSGKGEP